MVSSSSQLMVVGVAAAGPAGVSLGRVGGGQSHRSNRRMSRLGRGTGWEHQHGGEPARGQMTLECGIDQRAGRRTVEGCVSLELDGKAPEIPGLPLMPKSSAFST